MTLSKDVDTISKGRYWADFLPSPSSFIQAWD